MVAGDSTLDDLPELIGWHRGCGHRSCVKLRSGLNLVLEATEATEQKLIFARDFAERRYGECRDPESKMYRFRIHEYRQEFSASRCLRSVWQKLDQMIRRAGVVIEGRQNRRPAPSKTTRIFHGWPSPRDPTQVSSRDVPEIACAKLQVVRR